MLISVLEKIGERKNQQNKVSDDFVRVDHTETGTLLTLGEVKRKLCVLAEDCPQYPPPHSSLTFEAQLTVLILRSPPPLFLFMLC